jgi:hypothetical protein
MKTSAFMIAAIIVAAVLAGSGCSALPLAAILLQVLVLLAGFFRIVDWRWVLTLDIWIWPATPATLFLSALCDKKAFVHFAIHGAISFAKFLFSLV